MARLVAIHIAAEYGTGANLRLAEILLNLSQFSFPYIHLSLLMPIRCPLYLCLFAAGAGISLEAAAHGSSSAMGVFQSHTAPANGWLAVSGVIVLTMLAVRSAANNNRFVRRTAWLIPPTATAVVGVFWPVDAWVLAGLVSSAWLYAAGIRRLWSEARFGGGISAGRAACFFSGLAVLVIALVSPVDALGDELFSMHMVQHELMMLGAAPLLVAGNPLAAFIWAFAASVRPRIARLARSTAVRATWGVLTRPPVAWLLHALMLWAWHFPSLFAASLADEGMHTLQHVSFLGSALLFWASLIGSHNRSRDGTAAVYVLTTILHTGVLGALLTFSPRPWYPGYAGRTEAWGLSLLEDQQLGGLIMWVPAGFVLLGAGLWFAARAISPRTGAKRELHALER